MAVDKFLIESVRRYDFSYYIVRIWTQRKLPPKWQVELALREGGTPRRAAVLLMQQVLANAIEVVELDGKGYVIYRNWP